MKTSGMIEMLIKGTGWPKVSRLLMATGLATLLATGITGCSSSEEEDSGEEVVDEEGGTENAAAAEEGGESVPEDEAVAEAGANGGNTGTNVPAEDPAAINTSGINSTTGNPAALATEDPAAAPAAAATDPAAVTAPVDPAATAPVAAGPGLALPAGTSAVVYVSGSSATLYDAPNGKQVGGMERGDYVLASAEGEWAKTHDGKYVRASELSTKAVGRKRTRSQWHSHGQK